jgi:hypothetical protein
MCNRARLSSEPETLFDRFGAGWAQDVVRPNKTRRAIPEEQGVRHP